MTDLIGEFFKRDLSEAEAQALDSLLENSSEGSLRFGQMLRGEYLGLGLPDPGAALPTPAPAPLALTKAALVLAGVMAAGTVGWWFWPAPQVISIANSIQPAAPKTIMKTKTPLAPPPLVIPERLNVSSPEGNRLSVVVELAKPAPVKVFIQDDRGQVVRALYDGKLEAGKWSLRWDGLLADGAKAPSGDYRIQVESGSHKMAKNVSVSSPR